MIKLAEQFRPLDKNIHAYLSDEKQKLYYIENLKHPAMNRIVNKPEELQENEKYKLIITSVLNEILEKNKKYLDNLLYLSIDLEFYDELILKSLRFDKYHPLVITIEIHDFNFYKKNKICKYLEQYGYTIHSYIKPTAVYIDKNF